MYNVAAAMENSMEAPQKVKNRTAMLSSNPNFGCSKTLKSGSAGDICTPMFIAAVFRDKRWKQPKCPLTDEQIKCDI